jgi:hypothetical protein
MNAPAEAFRCQALAKEIVAELRAKYDLKAAKPCRSAYWIANDRDASMATKDWGGQ